jgi:hypothetical protein
VSRGHIGGVAAIRPDAVFRMRASILLQPKVAAQDGVAVCFHTRLRGIERI